MEGAWWGGEPRGVSASFPSVYRGILELCRCSWLRSGELAEGLLSASPGEDDPPGDAEVAVPRVPCRDWHPVEGPHEARQRG